jgi:hypothetical protein
MKDYYAWFIVVFLAICCCILSYRHGFAVGQSTCPIKYAICENGTCVLSDIPPSYPGK